jgi:class 3 adenylate cyclase
MASLPLGTVTLLFTDIEGSTRLLYTLGERYRDALEQHRALLRQAFSSHGGIEVDTQGDAFFYSFPTPQGALQAAIRAQRALARHPLAARRRAACAHGDPHRHPGGHQ